MNPMLITPCTEEIKKLNECGEPLAVAETLMRKVMEEFNEVHEAHRKAWGMHYTSNPKDDRMKLLQELGEELGDAMTICSTYLEWLAGLEDMPEDFDDDCLLVVRCKNHARGRWHPNE